MMGEVEGIEQRVGWGKKRRAEIKQENQPIEGSREQARQRDTDRWLNPFVPPTERDGSHGRLVRFAPLC